jgi:hypothetical protein
MSGLLKAVDNRVIINDDGASVVSIARQGPQGPPGADGAGGTPEWGQIIGTITDQTDLISYIGANGGGGVGMFVQPTTPVGATEGNLWYKTDTESLFVYREVSPTIFNWVPLIMGTDTSDVIDGGNY